MSNQTIELRSIDIPKISIRKEKTISIIAAFVIASIFPGLFLYTLPSYVFEQDAPVILLVIASAMLLFGGPIFLILYAICEVVWEFIKNRRLHNSLRSEMQKEHAFGSVTFDYDKKNGWITYSGPTRGRPFEHGHLAKFNNNADSGVKSYVLVLDPLPPAGF